MRVVSPLLRTGAAAVAAIAVAQVLQAAPAAPLKIGAPPGGAPVPDTLQRRLRDAVAAQGPAYRPRTRHRNPDGSPKYTNRLVLEHSPYLLQHAHNPVDWYPWGDEAFARARAEGKPVLLSVGYATCHWCHVMEEESFEDEAIAAYLNAHYIAIKVDRERRPDVDEVYLAAVQLMGERGGWPMTVWLTPDRQPFYGGTYFPPRDGDRGVRVGFLTLLEKLHETYRARPDDVAAAAADVSTQVRARAAEPGGSGLPTGAVLHAAFGQFQRQFDRTNGGFGGAPKFPRSVQIEALLRYHRRTGDPEALRMAERTLEAMAAGGIHDQVGGGFHRYATDGRWLVPHFEKMLYDNALLAVAYLEAYQVTGRPDFARVARDILAYIEREMTAPEGGFYSASDADSEGEEGRFFVWTPAEMAAALTPEHWRLARAYYAVGDGGNFHGRSILHAPRPLDAVARDLGLDPAAAPALLDEARSRLSDARRRREPPLTDRKILAAWNGLMISAFARASQVLAEPAYALTAGRAADYVLTAMRRDGRLRRSAFNGQVGGDGYLDDYAFVTAALLDLYETIFDPRRLHAAIDLEGVLDEHFADREQGGWFLTADDAEALLARAKPVYDGAEPSGNSVATLNALRLHELTGDDRYRQRADAALRAFEPALAAAPTSAPRLLGALDFRLDRPKQIVIVTPGAVDEAEPFLARLRAAFVPNRIVVVTADGTPRTALAEIVPLVADKTPRSGRPTAYVCERRVCDLPTADPAVFAQQIGRVESLSLQGAAAARRAR